MLNLENCRKELLTQGIETEEIALIKNGVECRGIRIINSDGVMPVVYYSETDTMDEFMKRIEAVVSREKPQVDPRKLMEWEYVRNNLYVSVQRRSNEDIVKRPYLNLDMTMRIYMKISDNLGTVKMTRSLMENIGVSEEVLWNIAVSNSRNKYHISNMAEILGAEDTGDGLYVVTAEELIDGASALYFPEIFAEFCQSRGEKTCYILPSSTQEVIVLPESMICGSFCDPAELCEMVRIINAEQVDPLIQLQPVVYRLTESGEIEIVARTGKES